MESVSEGRFPHLVLSGLVRLVTTYGREELGVVGKGDLGKGESKMNESKMVIRAGPEVPFTRGQNKAGVPG